MKVATRIMLAATLFASGAPMNMALAQADPGIYAGFFFGASDSKSSAGDFADQAQLVYGSFGIATAPSAISPLDTEDSGYGFQVGYRFNSWLAIEGGYLDLGDTTYRETALGVFVDDPDQQVDTFSQKITSKVSGLTVSVLGIIPLSYRWELYGRAGLLFGNEEVDNRIANSFDSVSFDASESITDVMLGAGISFSLAEIYSIRAEFLRVLDGGDEFVGESDIDLLSLGVTVRF